MIKWIENLNRKLIKIEKQKEEDSERNSDYYYGNIEFIWGVKSSDELFCKEANLYTMNDIDICFDHKDEKYILDIETAYYFENGYKDQVKYYDSLLTKFTEYMEENNYNTSLSNISETITPICDLKANSIEELYIMFRIFVEGLKAVYNQATKEERGKQKWISTSLVKEAVGKLVKCSKQQKKVEQSYSVETPQQ